MAKQKRAANKSFSTGVSIWPMADGSIRLRIADTVMTTVNEKTGSKRCHEHLYRQLRTVLAQR